MEKRELEGASEICKEYLGELIENYTRSALSLNAIRVAVNHYAEMEDNFILRTTDNIPKHYQFELEIGKSYEKTELIEYYRADAIKQVATDNLIRTVSLLDAFFEDLYEYFLRIHYPEYNDKKIGRMVRNAWGVDETMRKFFTQDLNLKQANDIVPISIHFDRYEDWREVRHAIMHNRGKLGNKHIARLEELRDRQPNDLKLSLIETPVISGNDINLGYATIFHLRMFAYLFISYMHGCFAEAAK